MIWYLVSWVAFLCPGGMLKGLVPSSLRPLVCEQAPASAMYASELEAIASLKEHGVGATAQVCSEIKGAVRCEPLKVRWIPILEDMK